MPHITVCPRCGSAYEEVSEEEANSPARMCDRCYDTRTREQAPMPRVADTVTPAPIEQRTGSTRRP